MKRKFHVRSAFLSLLSMILLSLPSCELVDTGGLDGVSGSTTAYFAGSPEGTAMSPMSEGVIKSVENSLGLFMKSTKPSNTVDNARSLVRGSSIYGEAYLGIIPEDIFHYARLTNRNNFAAGKAVDTDLLTIASRCKMLLTLYTKEVFLLVKKTSGINKIEDLDSTKIVNIGSPDTETFISASSILDAHRKTCMIQKDSAESGILKVASGGYDAAFLVDSLSSPVLKSIKADAAVKLIRVTMPEGSAYYSQTGIINQDTFPFMTESINGSARVSSVLAAGSRFNDDKIELLLKNIVDSASSYLGSDKRWKEVTITRNEDLILRYPQLWNYRALCYIAGYPRLKANSLGNGFFSGYADSIYHAMTVELVWLLSHNADTDLKERNSTGGWENAYRILTGEASMAMVTDGIFSSLAEKKSLHESVMIASMKRIVPLNEEYVHLIVPLAMTGNNIESFRTAAAKKINVGPKTSGTFISAIKIMKSYGFSQANNIEFCYDSESDGVAKVANGTYTAAFVTTGVPYTRFYSHDTYSIPVNCKLIPAQFRYADTTPAVTPFPYRNGTLAGAGAAMYENYPYPKEILAANIKTTVVRGMLVSSPVFSSAYTERYIKSIFRFAEYETEPSDPEWWALGYQPNFPWIAVRKETITRYQLNNTVFIDETLIGTREYFINDPFGWNDKAAEYYITMF